jgi:hypothetical protein
MLFTSGHPHTYANRPTAFTYSFVMTVPGGVLLMSFAVFGARDFI